MSTGQAFYDLSADQQAEHLTLLARQALRSWPGSYRDLTLVKHRENAVFSAFGPDGRRVALRVHRHAYHCDAALHSELAWMQALAEEGMQVPVVLPTATGELFAHAAHPKVPETRQVDMLAWLPGDPIGSVEDGLNLDGESPQHLFFAMGELAARLHQHSGGWTPPGVFQRHAWDEAGLIGPQPFWGPFWDLPLLSAQERLLLERARHRAAEDLATFGKGADRYGLIHADFAPENLLRNERGLVLIDFDDCGFGWHMFELATVLFLRLGERDYQDLAEALFEGYEAVRPLSADQRAALPLFLFLRGSTYLGWIKTRYETAFARQLAPEFIERVCGAADAYLAG